MDSSTPASAHSAAALPSSSPASTTAVTLPRPSFQRRDTSGSQKYNLSYEADDEWSVSDRSSDMGHPAGSGRQYEGEDTRPTSKKELRGFYMYGWASEVFVVCGMGSFIPITLEQLARERGVLASDRSTPCTAGLEVPRPGYNLTGSVSLSASAKPPVPDATQCIVTLLGVDINTASFAMYTFSISVLVQTLLIISMSGAADHGHYRKTFLLTFAFLGSISTMLFLPIVPQVILLGSVFAIIGNTCFGASGVLLNSFLPLLVRNDRSLQGDGSPNESAEDAEGSSHRSEGLESNELQNSTSALLPDSDVRRRRNRTSVTSTTSAELKLSARISANGVGIGYLAALIVQILGIFTVKSLGSTLFSLRLVLFQVGAWWFCFTIPAAFWLRPRPGPPLHLNPDYGKVRSGLAYIAYSWKSLGKSLMRARLLRDVLQFLAAWFLLSDGIATISGTAILFAKTSLEMKPAALALINIVVTLSGIFGALAWSKISAIMGLKPIQTIFACICILELIPLYGLLGYIPAIQHLGMLGLQQAWEMYPLGAVYGFVLGGLSSFCRSLFGELIPPGFEAAFYALYAITDKGSSVFGPAIVGAIIDGTGEIRPAFWFLAVLIGLPMPLVLLVNVERGRRDGIALAKELQDAAEPADGEGDDESEQQIRLLDEEADGDGPADDTLDGRRDLEN